MLLFSLDFDSSSLISFFICVLLHFMPSDDAITLTSCSLFPAYTVFRFLTNWSFPLIKITSILLYTPLSALDTLSKNRFSFKIIKYYYLLLFVN